MLPLPQPPFVVPDIAVTAQVWMMPMPDHSAGWIVLYGSRRMAELNALYRGYDPKPYKCLGSLMSPSDLGHVFWLRTNDSNEWYGPCLDIDSAQRLHFGDYVYNKHEIAEVDLPTAEHFNFEYGVRGEIYVGQCPPRYETEPTYYSANSWEPDWMDPTAQISYLRLFWPYQQQQLPAHCEHRRKHHGYRP